MRNAPNITVSAPHGGRTNTLHARAIIGYGTFYVQVVDINISTFFGVQIVDVFHCRTQQFFDYRRHPLLGERQGVERIFDTAAFNEVEYQPRLLRQTRM